jgi:hypothetical protein
MSNLLTLEDKKYLQRICRYFGSMGMSHGSVEFDMEYGQFDKDDYNWNRITHFSNNYTAEIPDGLKEILKKVIDYVSDNDLISSPDVDGINWERIEIDIDCDGPTISVSHDYNYYEASDTESVTRSLEEDGDDENLMEVLDVLENDDEIDERVLRIDYNGSGDSGYLEDAFDNIGVDVPAQVQDYCYNILESNFGGWEINEGSQGYFEIDLDRKEITLYHTANLDETGRDTVFEEDF